MPRAVSATAAPPFMAEAHALLEVMALGTTRIGATATKTIIDDFRARKAGHGPVSTGAGTAAGAEGGY